MAKKLQQSIATLGHYEAVIVRPHPRREGQYEILNGHARVDAMRSLGKQTIRCDVWDVNMEQTRLLLATLDQLSGDTVPELRMNLLLRLLNSHTAEDLGCLLPENGSYLRLLERLCEGCNDREPVCATKDSRIVLDIYLTREQYGIVQKALHQIMKNFSLSRADEALCELAENYLAQK